MNVNCVVSRSGRLCDQTGKIYLETPLAWNNALAHAMRYTALDDAWAAADLTGIGVTGSFLRADGETVEPINGTVTGNVAEVILPPACYIVPGHFKFTMHLTDQSGATRSVMWVEGTVERNTSTAQLDPGTPISNISQAIGQANAAANAATSAASDANAAAGAANTAAGTANTAADNATSATGAANTAANAANNAATNANSAASRANTVAASVETDINGIKSDITTINGKLTPIAGHFTANDGFKVGEGTSVTGANSVAEGTDSKASNQNAHAEGNGSVASGKNAHAEGGWNFGMTSDPGKRYSTASGTSSHAEGSGCHAEGTGTHAEGVATTSIGEGAHAEGRVTTARGTGSHAEGLQTIAYYNYQHVSGQFNATENAAEIVGNGVDDANRSNIRVLDWNGNEKIAGSLTIGMGTADEVTVTAAQLKALLALLS